MSFGEGETAPQLKMLNLAIGATHNTDVATELLVPYIEIPDTYTHPYTTPIHPSTTLHYISVSSKLTFGQTDCLINYFFLFDPFYCEGIFHPTYVYSVA